MSEQAVKEMVQSILEAYAAGGGAIWQIILLVFLVVGGPLIGLLFFYVKKGLAKAGIELEGTMRKFVIEQADSVIDQVEAWANKKKLANALVTEADKIEKGLKLLSMILESSGVLKKMEVNLEHVIEERLMARGMVKIPPKEGDAS